MSLGKTWYLFAITLVVSLAVYQNTHATTPPDLLDRDCSRVDGQEWWNHVQQGLAEAEYHASRNGQGLQAPNRAHNLRTFFDSAGIRIHSRTAA